jgi:hypothetical protein
MSSCFSQVRRAARRGFTSRGFSAAMSATPATCHRTRDGLYRADPLQRLIQTRFQLVLKKARQNFCELQFHKVFVPESAGNVNEFYRAWQSEHIQALPRRHKTYLQSHHKIINRQHAK